MKNADFCRMVTGACNLATASGLAEHEQAFSLLIMALGIIDRKAPNGCTREDFLKCSGFAFDRVRAALAAGPQS